MRMGRRRKRRLAAGIIMLGAAIMLLLRLSIIPPAGAQTGPAVQLAPPPPGLARVWFLRQFEPGESLWTPMIYVNGSAMTPSLPGTIFYRDFAPGTYTFTVDSCGSDTNQFPTVRLTPGTQYEFEVQSLQSFRPPDCPRGSGVFYIRPVQPRFLQMYLPQLAYLGAR
jgi:hypothetical protein